MKFNTAFVSTVLLACASLTTAVEVGPFFPWRSVTNSNLCVQPVNTADGAPLNGGTSNACAWIDDGGPFNGETVRLGECTNSNGSGKTVNNAQWDSVTPLPNVVQLKSHIHFNTTNGCIDIVNSNVVTEGCNASSLSQKWIVGE
ncbi:hypothetical protein DFH09DRAFT_1171906 [Mycena vulgaris]|nr:hypothetical protein DFH09DRAFT_1171906 [Mycena vulgaris]